MKRRIGNDLPIEVNVTRFGEPENLNDYSTLAVRIKSAYGDFVPFDFMVDGNTIKGVFYGKDQKMTGDYIIELVKNAGEVGMITLDQTIVTLVDRTAKEQDIEDCEIIDIDITTGKNGLSAYELARAQGFEGTLEEYLDSLYGPFRIGSGKDSAQNKRGVATGVGATAIGANAIASGDYSFAEGSKGIKCGFKAVENKTGQYICTDWTFVYILFPYIKKLYRVPPVDATPDDIANITFVSERIVESDRTLTKDTWYIYPEAVGIGSHQEGDGHAFGANSHAEGIMTIARSSSHAEGYGTVAFGYGAHAEGYGTKTSKSYSHAEGEYTEAGGQASHAEGHYTKTQNQGEHAEGWFNKSNGRTLHSIGIGYSEKNRKNAFEVMGNGDAFLYGLGGYDGTNPDNANTIQQVVAAATTGGGTFLGLLKPNDSAPESTEGGFYVSTEKGHYFNGFCLKNNFMLIWTNQNGKWSSTKIRIKAKPNPQMVLWRHLPLVSDGSCWYFIKTDLGIRGNSNIVFYGGNLFMNNNRLREIEYSDYPTSDLRGFISELRTVGVFVRGPWDFSDIKDGDAATDGGIAQEILERVSRHWVTDSMLSGIKCESTKVMYDFKKRCVRNIEKVKYDPIDNTFKNSSRLVVARWKKYGKTRKEADGFTRATEYYTKYQRLFGGSEDDSVMNLVWYSRKYGKKSSTRWGKNDNVCLSGGDGPKSLLIQTSAYDRILKRYLIE
nr:MAG TPA: YadA-like protein [Caudoviricetes sp.]